jgi:outer membrane protein assembly factor BamE (lipoprotein component of BamABCDE complex)
VTASARGKWDRRFLFLMQLPMMFLAFVLAVFFFVGTFCMPALLGHSTVYAENYNERNFQRISQGMTASEVAALIGQPLRRSSWGRYNDVWHYTDQRTPVDNFWRRWIAFERGCVADRICDFWVD